LFSETWKHEAEIVSNRKLVCYGETKVKPCTHCPSRSKSFEYGSQTLFWIFFFLKNSNIHKQCTIVLAKCFVT